MWVITLFGKTGSVCREKRVCTVCFKHFLMFATMFALSTVHCPPVISETLKKVSVSTAFAQSRVVSVSTSFKFLGLKEYQSRHLSKLPVSKSLGLDNFCFLSLADSLSIFYMDYQYYLAFM